MSDQELQDALDQLDESGTGPLMHQSSQTALNLEVVKEFVSRYPLN